MLPEVSNVSWIDAGVTRESPGTFGINWAGNGRIEDISGLFGGLGRLGLEELVQYDENGDLIIDAADLIWQDLDQDGVSDDGELSSLDELGIASISVEGTLLDGHVMPQGTTLHREGEFTWSSGEVGNLFEALFELNRVDTIYRGEKGLAPWLADLSLNAKGYGRIADLSVAMSNDFELAA